MGRAITETVRRMASYQSGIRRDCLIIDRRQKLTYSPANAEAAQLYKDNTKEYERRVKVCHRLSAHRIVADLSSKRSNHLGSTPPSLTPKLLLQRQSDPLTSVVSLPP